MPNLIRRALVPWLLLACLGCASGASSARPPSGSRPDLIGPEELATAQWANVYEMVSSLRPRWLQSRGPDSFSKPSVVQVVVDDVKLGGVNALRNLPTSGITSLQFFDGLTATSRWGLDFGSGAIYVSTRRR
jgi:hypothetical protein